MPVKILPADEKEINEFLATSGIKISTKHVIPSPGGDAYFAIFYETAESDEAARVATMAQQSAGLESILDVARKVRKDPGYAALKNISQREVWLQAQYGILKSDTGTIIALLTPEMVGILGA